MRLRLRREARQARVRLGHPWVFKGEVQGLLSEDRAGTGVGLEDEQGRFLGSGVYNPYSQIVWRRYSREEVAWDAAFFEHALREAIARRDDDPVRRLVWSEADTLPGYVVDQYAGALVVQALTLAADRHTEAFLEVLTQHVPAEEVILRNDAPTREREGLERSVRTRSGQPWAARFVPILELDYWLDLQGGQKTGFYLDQREEHFKVSTLAEGWRVLDAFCHIGGFGLNCARAGAREVIALDSSAEAVETAQRNAERNQLQLDARQANVFDWLAQHPQERFDLIVLDPPSFARNRAAVPGALRGYRELNRRALSMLTSGGILATYTCSQSVERSVFNDVVFEAAADAGRDGCILYETAQPLDHPVRLHFPESAYLKGLLLRVD